LLLRRVLISALGVAIGQYWMVILGYGFVADRLGIGYISPVSTLIKWFPAGRAWHRIAIIFGGGALIAFPRGSDLDAPAVSAPPVEREASGIAKTFLVHRPSVYAAFCRWLAGC